MPSGRFYVRFQAGCCGGQAGVRVSEAVPKGLGVAEAKGHVAALRRRAARQLSAARDNGYRLADLAAEYWGWLRLRAKGTTYAG